MKAHDPIMFKVIFLAGRRCLFGVIVGSMPAVTRLRSERRAALLEINSQAIKWREKRNGASGLSCGVEDLQSKTERNLHNRTWSGVALF